jgi:hypothetical protein
MALSKVKTRKKVQTAFMNFYYIEIDDIKTDRKCSPIYNIGFSFENHI